MVSMRTTENNQQLQNREREREKKRNEQKTNNNNKYIQSFGILIHTVNLGCYKSTPPQRDRAQMWCAFTLCSGTFSVVVFLSFSQPEPTFVTVVVVVEFFFSRLFQKLFFGVAHTSFLLVYTLSHSGSNANLARSNKKIAPFHLLTLYLSV